MLQQFYLLFVVLNVYLVIDVDDFGQHALFVLECDWFEKDFKHVDFLFVLNFEVEGAVMVGVEQDEFFQAVESIWFIFAKVVWVLFEFQLKLVNSEDFLVVEACDVLIEEFEYA